MRLCIHFEPFDIDVSSGTIHAAHQWHELCVAFGVTDLAVINSTGEPFPQINGAVRVQEIDQIPSDSVFLEMGDHSSIQGADIGDSWLVIGPAVGISGVGEYLTIPVDTALYPREAAAIALWELSKWR